MKSCKGKQKEILDVCDEFNKSDARFRFFEYNDILEALIMLDTIEKIEEIATKASK
nr:MAG TPA: hypothetical protein [Caudoviricetes sp.]